MSAGWCWLSQETKCTSSKLPWLCTHRSYNFFKWHNQNECLLHSNHFWRDITKSLRLHVRVQVCWKIHVQQNTADFHDENQKERSQVIGAWIGEGEGTGVYLVCTSLQGTMVFGMRDRSGDLILDKICTHRDRAAKSMILRPDWAVKKTKFVLSCVRV